MVARAQQAGLLPPDYPVEDARRQLQLFKAHLEVARTDRPEPYPGRVTFFAAEEQPELPCGVPTSPATAGPPTPESWRSSPSPATTSP